MDHSASDGRPHNSLVSKVKSPKPLISTAHVHHSDLRGFSQLIIDATTGLIALAESLHCAFLPIPEPENASAHAHGTRRLYGRIRQLTTRMGEGLDKRIQQLLPLLDASGSSFAREAVLAALNGIMGDYLDESGSPLAIPMGFRYQGRSLRLEKRAMADAVPQPTDKLMVLVHGLCMNDLQWGQETADTGDSAIHYALLAKELGYTPVYLHYNSGRHISTNGRDFATMLERLVTDWPVPVQSLVIVGYSLGGLVTRSACFYGARAQNRWFKRLKAIVFLGTPHQGAPLERGGNRVDIALETNRYTAPFARLGKIRSAAITDLRYGYLLDEDWEGRDRFERAGDKPRIVPLPGGVLCYAVAVTNGLQTDGFGDRILGDGLIPTSSALGIHPDPDRCLSIPPSRRWIGCGISHLGLLSHPAVFEQVRGWLMSSPFATATPGVLPSDQCSGKVPQQH